MRMDIDIRVEVPDYSKELQGELSMEFTEGVMEVFRRVFPEANPILRPGAPPPVTVTFHELEPYIPDPSARRIHIPRHEEILKRMEEDKKGE